MAKQIEIDALSTSLIVASLPPDAQNHMGDHLRLGAVEYVGDSVNTGKVHIKIGDRVLYQVSPNNKNTLGSFVVIDENDVVDCIKPKDQIETKPAVVIKQEDCDKVLTACKEWYEVVMRHSKIAPNPFLSLPLGSLNKLNQTLHEVFGRNDEDLDMLKRLLKTESKKQFPKDHDTKLPIRPKELFVLQSKRRGDLVAIRSSVSKEIDPLLQHCVCGNFYLACGRGVEANPAVAFRYEREINFQEEIEIINNARVAEGMRPLDKTTMDSKYWPAVYVNVDTGSGVYMAVMDTTDLKFVSEHFVETPPNSDSINILLRQAIPWMKRLTLQDRLNVNPMFISVKHKRKLGSSMVIVSQDCRGFYLADGIMDNEPVCGLSYVRQANSEEISSINEMRLKEGLGIAPRDCIAALYYNAITCKHIVLAKLSVDDMEFVLKEFEAQDKQCVTKHAD